MNDPRVSAAAKAVHQYDVGVQLCSTYAPNKHHRAEAQAAIEAADAADREQGIHRVRVDDATVERCAEAAALVDDLDGCFEHIREWEALEEWEQEAQGYPSDDYEARADWIKRTRAVLAALTGAEV